MDFLWYGPAQVLRWCLPPAVSSGRSYHWYRSNHRSDDQSHMTLNKEGGNRVQSKSIKIHRFCAVLFILFYSTIFIVFSFCFCVFKRQTPSQILQSKCLIDKGLMFFGWHLIKKKVEFDLTWFENVFLNRQHTTKLLVWAIFTVLLKITDKSSRKTFSSCTAEPPIRTRGHGDQQHCKESFITKGSLEKNLSLKLLDNIDTVKKFNHMQKHWLCTTCHSLVSISDNSGDFMSPLQPLHKST